MTAAVEGLIARLTTQLRPVRRLRPPVLRAALWLLAVAAIGAAAILGFADLAIFAERMRDPKLGFELAGTLLTGIAAVIAAFELSLPDRSPRWMLLPAAPLLLWIAGSGYNCYRHWIIFGPDGWELGESTHCFRFILGVSLPLALSLWPLLRRARPLSPFPVAAMGGIGVAGIAAFLLQFFHPFDITFMDLGVHVFAVALVALIAGALGARTPLRGVA